MKRERENTSQQYGALNVREYNIAGNLINAFYDSADNLVFVMDNTIKPSKPNVLLVINPSGDKKWDEILSVDYGVDLELIRPKQDNKYQKLDIEYSGLNVYDNLIRAYLADDDMEDDLIQLNILRDSAMRHSAMMRLNVANETISKTNITIVKTKETITNLQERIKTLRAKLSATKKEIGRVPTKQSASRVLKIESQIDATNEKLKRAKKRLESAQRRLESATVDAELASDLLNQPQINIPENKPINKPIAVAPKYPVQTIDADEMDDDQDVDDEQEYAAEPETQSDVKPLFDQDPEILDEDIAFKPISFEAPTFENMENKNEQSIAEPVQNDIPMLNTELFNETSRQEVVEPIAPLQPTPIVNVENAPSENRPVLETMSPIVPENNEIQNDTQINDDTEEYTGPVPVAPLIVNDNDDVLPQPETPVSPINPMPSVVPPAPIVNNKPVAAADTKPDSARPTFIYYLLLFVLIILSVFTLWLYQKNIKPTVPVLNAVAEETDVVEKRLVAPETVSQPKAIVSSEETDETVFLDDAVEPEPKEPVAELATDDIVLENETVDEGFVQPEPEILNSVPARVMTSGQSEPEYVASQSEEEIIANKPVYEPGNKHNAMFVSDDYDMEMILDDGQYPDDVYFDAEEEAFLSGDDGYSE